MNGDGQQVRVSGDGQRVRVNGDVVGRAIGDDGWAKGSCKIQDRQ